jgi:hypothetical protein
MVRRLVSWKWRARVTRYGRAGSNDEITTKNTKITKRIGRTAGLALCFLLYLISLGFSIAQVLGRVQASRWGCDRCYEMVPAILAGLLSLLPPRAV